MNHIQERQFAISRLKETAFNTPRPTTTAAPLAYQYLLVKDQNLANWVPTILDNDGFSTGNDLPTETYRTRWDVNVDHQMQLEVDMIGRLLYAALGAVTTTNPDTIVYQHVFKPVSPLTGRQLPPYTYVEKLASTLNHLFASMVIERLTIRGNGTDRLEVDFSLRGSGKRVSPSLVNFGGGTNHVLTPTFRYLFNSQAVLKTRDYTTLANEINYSNSCRFRNFEFTIENSLLGDDGYCPGNAAFQIPGNTTSGQIRNELLFGKRNYTMQFVVRINSASDEFADIQNERAIDILITATGAQIVTTFNDKLILHIGLSKYQAIQIGNENGIVTFQITPRVLFDPSNGEVLDITLVNQTASYTT